MPPTVDWVEGKSHNWTCGGLLSRHHAGIHWAPVSDIFLRDWNKWHWNDYFSTVVQLSLTDEDNTAFFCNKAWDLKDQLQSWANSEYYFGWKSDRGRIERRDVFQSFQQQIEELVEPVGVGCKNIQTMQCSSNWQLINLQKYRSVIIRWKIIDLITVHQCLLIRTLKAERGSDIIVITLFEQNKGAQAQRKISPLNSGRAKQGVKWVKWCISKRVK